jgi:RsiW-degrading membrane proteinase PrsW (M82 family)
MIFSGRVFAYRVGLTSIVPCARLLFRAGNTKEAEPCKHHRLLSFIKYFQYQKLLHRSRGFYRDLCLCNPPVSCMIGHFVLGN